MLSVVLNKQQSRISARAAKSSAYSRSSPERSASTSGLHPKNPASRIGPCYKLRIYSYFPSFYFIRWFFPMLAHLLFLLCLLLAVLVSEAHCIILHIIVVSCCFNGTVNSMTEHKFLLRQNRVKPPNDTTEH